MRQLANKRALSVINLLCGILSGMLDFIIILAQPMGEMHP